MNEKAKAQARKEIEDRLALIAGTVAGYEEAARCYFHLDTNGYTLAKNKFLEVERELADFDEKNPPAIEANHRHDEDILDRWYLKTSLATRLHREYLVRVYESEQHKLDVEQGQADPAQYVFAGILTLNVGPICKHVSLNDCYFSLDSGRLTHIMGRLTDTFRDRQIHPDDLAELRRIAGYKETT